MENSGKEPRGYYVEKGSFFAHAAVTVLVLSIAARLLGTMNEWGEMSRLIVQVLLPVGCSLLFILFILLLGRIALWSTILPVLGGAAFFILSAFDQGPGWTLFICIALAFLAAFLYTATLAGMIRGKWILALVFALILAYLIVLRAVPVFGNTEQPVSFVDGMALLSTLGIVFAMFLAVLSFRRKKAVKGETELPKIKDPVVIPPAGAEEAGSPAETEASVPAEPAEGGIPEPQPYFDEAIGGAAEETVPGCAPEENSQE